jgi:phosphoribosylanthranilate isomerase
MQIKVCGITSFTQLKQLEDLNADFSGLIFYPLSKRYVSDHLEHDQQNIRGLQIKKIGVFVNQTLAVIEKAISDYGLYAVQLHGDETVEFCKELMNKAIVIKVFRLAKSNNIDALIAPFMEACHYFLFDTDTAGYGGSGKKFNWELIQHASIKKPFFLSGGIGACDVTSIRSFHHPYLFAIDVNSHFETEPGLKDMQMVDSFIKTMKNG